MPLCIESSINNNAEMLHHMKLKTQGRPKHLIKSFSVSSVSLSSFSSLSSDEGTENIANSANNLKTHQVISITVAGPVAIPNAVPVISARTSNACIAAKNSTSSSVATSIVPGNEATNGNNLIGTKRKVSDLSMADTPHVPSDMLVPSITNTQLKGKALHQLNQGTEQNCIEPEIPLFVDQQQIEESTSKKQAIAACNRPDSIIARPLPMPKPLNVFQKLSTLVAAATINSNITTSSSAETSTNILRLSLPEDNAHLNPIHRLVRSNIEVFVATDEDIAAPSPGRKTAIVRGQVGLRCIHCRNVKHKNRTKRAACYPSKTSRVYNCVSDMKVDHFTKCKYFPEEERKLFDELAIKRRKGSRRGRGGNHTARYYYESAVKIGMVEAPNGIVLLKRRLNELKGGIDARTVVPHDVNNPLHSSSLPRLPPDAHVVIAGLNTSSRTASFKMKGINSSSRLTSSSNSTIQMPSVWNLTGTCGSIVLPSAINFNTRTLASAGDALVLNPVHCFVRNNVEVFEADSIDVTAPAPGRKKPVRLGQIGIRCIHCKHLPPELRVKRAICYPPTTSSLYHAISNMKFDHFGACKGLAPSMRQHFAYLKESSRREEQLTATGTTAKYYRESAEKDLGLINTDHGIRSCVCAPS